MEMHVCIINQVSSINYGFLNLTFSFNMYIEKSGACDPKVRIWDTQNNADPYIRYDGTPFIIMGKRVLECHQGFDRDSKTNQKKQTKSPAVSIICCLNLCKSTVKQHNSAVIFIVMQIYPF